MISAYDAEEKLFTVHYEDGDEEEFTLEEPANNLAMDETHVYWTDAHSDATCGTVRRRPIEGGEIEVVASEPESHIWGLALGPDDVVWTAWGANRVMRIAK